MKNPGKTMLALAILYQVIFMFSGCKVEQDPSMTEQEMEQIRKEVRAAAEPLMTGWAALDGPTALKSFSREMTSCYDTLLLDYETYALSWNLYAEARDSIKITEVKRDFLILTRELVIDTWVGNVEEWMKTGEKVTYKPIRYTNLFRKADGEWKIIFAQSSGIPIVEALE